MRRILETARAFGEAAWAWWSDLAAEASWPPALGPWLLALLALLLLAALRRRSPPPLEVRPPQLLITQGEVLPEAGPQTAPVRRRRPGGQPTASAGRLTMTLSNLSRYPVQVLEVALRQESRGAARVAELEAVVPPLGALELAVRVPLGLSGDGWLDVYCYAAAPRQKLHRHRAELVWEPWVSRFKVAPMEQTTTAAKRLASDERSARFEWPEASEASAASTPAGDAREPLRGAGPPPVAAPAAAPAAEVQLIGDDVEPRDAVAHDAVSRDTASRDAPAPEATPLGALWARLPKRVPERGPAPDTAVGGADDGRPRRRADGSPRDLGGRRDHGGHLGGVVAGDAAGGRGNAGARDADAPKKRPRLEFPDDF